MADHGVGTRHCKGGWRRRSPPSNVPGEFLGNDATGFGKSWKPVGTEGLEMGTTWQFVGRLETSGIEDIFTDTVHHNSS